MKKCPFDKKECIGSECMLFDIPDGYGNATCLLKGCGDN